MLTQALSSRGFYYRGFSFPQAVGQDIQTQFSLLNQFIQRICRAWTLPPFLMENKGLYFPTNFSTSTHTQTIMLRLKQTQKSVTIWIGYSYFNDPTAGSPTVTLLRLLLPLNAQV